MVISPKKTAINKADNYGKQRMITSRTQKNIFMTTTTKPMTNVKSLADNKSVSNKVLKYPLYSSSSP